MIMKKLMIVTPAFGGKVDICYALSLSKTIDLLKKNNIEVLPFVVNSGSLLCQERNKLLEVFWNSDYTHVLCIDSDIGWCEHSVLRMLNSNKEFISGIYPSKPDLLIKKGQNFFNFHPIVLEDNSILSDGPLIRALYVPAGFMMFSKECLSKMREHHKNLYYESKIKLNIDHPQSGFAFFNTEIYEGEYWGEDFTFCRKVREAGIDIWVDPFINFEHQGQFGMLASTLLKQ